MYKIYSCKLDANDAQKMYVYFFLDKRTPVTLRSLYTE